MDVYKSGEWCVTNPCTQLQSDHFANLVLSAPLFLFWGGWREELEYFKVNHYIILLINTSVHTSNLEKDFFFKVKKITYTLDQMGLTHIWNITSPKSRIHVLKCTQNVFQDRSRIRPQPPPQHTQLLKPNNHL